MYEYELKENGYETPEEWKDTIKRFDEKAKEIFGDNVVRIEHFNYANVTIMSTLVISGENKNEYCGFRLGKRIVCTDTYTCSHENMKKFESMIEDK